MTKAFDMHPTDRQERLAVVTKRVRKAVGSHSVLNANVRLDFPDVGIIVIHARNRPHRVDNVDDDCNTSVVFRLEVFEQILDGKLDPKLALMSGRLRVDGDLAVAMQLDEVFQLPPFNR